MTRKSLIVKDPQGHTLTDWVDPSSTETTAPTIAYGRMAPDELVDHFIDDNGLAAFLDLRQTGIPPADWNWSEIARDLQAFSRGYLTFSPWYLADLYAMQRSRRQPRARPAAAPSAAHRASWTMGAESVPASRDRATASSSPGSHRRARP